MCGIFGFVNTPNNDKSIIQRMQSKLIHRGPDQQSHFSNSVATLGFVRLSILDLDSRSMQPMVSEDKNVVLTFNGEIYNYKALKEELEQKDIIFKTKGDAEVLLQTYLYFGLEETLQKINGMFAIALYHTNEDKLILIRDRLGKKPLYYQHINGHTIYASELKSLQEHPNFINTIDSLNIKRYLIFGGIAAPYTIYKNSYKVKAGEYVIINKSKIETHSYWSLNFKNKDLSLNREDAYKEFQELLHNSFLIRQEADVKKALYLSGGIDSTILAKMFYDNKIDIQTITSTFENQKSNEEHYAQEVINKYNLASNKLHIDLEHEKLYSLLNKFDEPFADSAILPTMMMSELVRQLGYSVVFTGDGGDELLGGYHSTNDYSMKNNLLYNLMTPLNIHTKKISTLKYLNPKYKSTSNFFQTFYVDSLDKKLYLDLIDEELYPMIQNSSTFLEFRQLFSIFYMQNFYNYKVDRATMAYSIEARSPLQDYRLYDFVSKLPTKYYSNSKQKGKLFLKEELLKDFSSSFVFRKKQGFGVPIGDFIDHLPLEKYLNTASIALEIPLDKDLQHKNKFLLFSLGHWLDSNL